MQIIALGGKVGILNIAAISFEIRFDDGNVNDNATNQ